MKRFLSVALVSVLVSSVSRGMDTADDMALPVSRGKSQGAMLFEFNQYVTAPDLKVTAETLALNREDSLKLYAKFRDDFNEKNKGCEVYKNAELLQKEVMIGDQFLKLLNDGLKTSETEIAFHEYIDTTIPFICYTRSYWNFRCDLQKVLPLPLVCKIPFEWLSICSIRAGC
ncbi:MAG: hypothetical protein LBB34_00375 [Holosporales bacterium]|jgi:hypothetical protein|nr:hypothetical protein [Holosporales bacterium]